ncbi:MAG: pyruvate formate lyase family protein [bacterium]
MNDTINSHATLTPRVQHLRDRLTANIGVLEGVANNTSLSPDYLGREPFHAAWMLHEGDSFEVRLAHAQAVWRASVQPQLLPGQLVIGTPPPHVVIAYPTGVFSWNFVLDTSLAEKHPETTEVFEYWQNWLANRPGPQLPADMNNPSLSDVLWVTGICCHSTQDYWLALSGGLTGLREKVKQARLLHPESNNWYSALEIAIDGVSQYILAHANAIEKAAETAENNQAVEWLKIATNCRHIAEKAPETFLQAVQLFYFLFTLNGHDSPGRMDQYLWPHLQRDLESGNLTIDEAQEIVDCLYLKLAEHICYGATLGGQLPEGGDATNTLTWLSLNSIQRLRLLSPRTALRWHKDIPDELFQATVNSIASGATYPTLVNDDVVVPAMVRRGATDSDARDYTFCGCGQVTPSGRAYGGYEDIILNAAKPLTYALHNGKDERSGDQMGPQTGANNFFKTFEEFEEAVWIQCQYLLKIGIDATNSWRLWGAKHVPDFLRSLVTHSCVEKGLDWRAGGADYHEGMVDVVGLSILTDSLMVIKQVVFEEELLTLSDLSDILDSNWIGSEDWRNICLNRIPKFGNENAEADAMAVKWLARLNEWLFEQKTAFGGPYGLDIIGWSGAVYLGAVTGATPDGRCAGDALADSAGPAQGRDKSGVTAMLNSMLKLPMGDAHGPLALNLRVPANIMNTPDAVKKLAALLRGYMIRGGQQVQVTVADTAEMRAAQSNPAQHRDLIVRVGGFSAYFVELEKRFQDDMIRRTEHGV